LSKDGFEAYITVIGQRHGARYVERRYLNVPLDVATGNIERISELALRELTNDCIAEDERRRELAEKRASAKTATGTYDPFASQIRTRGDHS
jgi:hypothetical protein